MTLKNIWIKEIDINKSDEQATVIGLDQYGSALFEITASKLIGERWEGEGRDRYKEQIFDTTSTLRKINKDGIEEWETSVEHTYESEYVLPHSGGEESKLIYRIVPYSRDNQTRKENPDISLTKIGSEGTMVWNKEFRFSGPSDQNQTENAFIKNRILAARADKSEISILVGTIKDEADERNRIKKTIITISLKRISTEGKLISSTDISHTESNRDEHGSNSAQLIDEYLAIEKTFLLDSANSIYSFDGIYRLCKFTAQGSLLWDQEVSPKSDSRPVASPLNLLNHPGYPRPKLVETSGRDVYLVNIIDLAKHAKDVRSLNYQISKFDEDGNLLWTQRLGNEKILLWNLESTVGKDGELYVRFNTSNSNYIAKYSPEGAVEWRRLSPSLPEGYTTYLGGFAVWDDSSIYRAGAIRESEEYSDRNDALILKQTYSKTPRALSGGYREGRVISNNELPSDYTDDLMGVTPALTYRWQVASQGSDSWVELNTTDAVDGNNTYMLTSNEIGKTIRGVVTFSDINGKTQQVVTSPSKVIIPKDAPSTFEVDQTSARGNQIVLQLTGNISNTAQVVSDRFSVFLNGFKQSISKITITGSSPASGRNRDQIVLTIGTSSLVNAQRLTVSYADANVMPGSGEVVDSKGERLETIEQFGIIDFVSNTSISPKTGLGLAYENLVLTGSGNLAAYGNEFQNTIVGNKKNNVIDGLGGGDTMKGRQGNDTYFIDNPSDNAIEELNEGVDTVRSSISWKLEEHIENLILMGSTPINGTGNNLRNTIVGNDLENILDGGSDDDTLIGGKGNDTYIVDSLADRITENGLKTDIDTVSSSVTWALGSNLENLTLTGTQAINGTGNILANIIIGNTANNILDGGVGGRDRLTGGEGADGFQFSTRPARFSVGEADRITDFAPSEGDTIRISKSAFRVKTEISAAAEIIEDLDGAELNRALRVDVPFVYNIASGYLYWNENGSAAGHGKGGIIAILENKLNLSARDVILF